jgi:ketosteroid isomerase-like protein
LDLMIEDKIELVKQGFAALDEGGPEALLEMVDPDFEVTTPPNLATEPNTYRGHDGVRRWFDEFYEVMEQIRFRGHDFEARGEKVFVDFSLLATGRSTGIEAEQRAFMVWTIPADKAVRLELFAEREDALAAAGLGS